MTRLKTIWSRLRYPDPFNPQIPKYPSYCFGVRNKHTFWRWFDNAYWSMRSLYYRVKRWRDARLYNHKDARVREKFAAKVVRDAVRRSEKQRRRGRVRTEEGE